jgi:hypothetical protein
MKQLTNLQFKLLLAIDQSEYGDALTDDVWTFSVLDSTYITARQLPGVIAGALKAGLVRVGNSENGRAHAQYIGMTSDGAAAYTQHLKTIGLQSKKQL